MLSEQATSEVDVALLKSLRRWKLSPVGQLAPELRICATITIL